MTAWYNEIDPFKAEVLRQAIAAGVIAPGVVDERSIVDVRPAELMGYTQCHFFAGGGFWSRVLRDAGVRDDERWWTGSCPCQPFSEAGKGAGFDDERHLWPYWHHLIRVCRPPRVSGEQVSSKDGLAWLDLVQVDMEGVGYACGPVVTPAAGYGAPHGRHRIYFMANPARSGVGSGLRDNGKGGFGWLVAANRSGHGAMAAARATVAIQHLGEPKCSGLEGYAGNGDDRNESGRVRAIEDGSVAETGAVGYVEHSDGGGRKQGFFTAETAGYGDTARATSESGNMGDTESGGRGVIGNATQPGNSGHIDGAGFTGGFWRDAEWIPCRHPKIPGAVEWRPIKPGTFCLADGSPARVGSLRLYGDGITLPQATEFIKAYKEGLAPCSP